MNVDFSKDGSAIPVESIVTPAAVQPPTPAPVTPAGVSVPATTGNSSNLVLGDRLPAFKDVILPRLNLVANTGSLKDEYGFTPGSWVFEKRVTLFTPQGVNRSTGNVERPATPPLNLTIVGIVAEKFAEKLEGGAMGGITVNSEDEVRAAGGTLDFKEWDLKKSSGMRRFENVIDFLVLLKRPESIADDDTVFGYNIDGAKYTLALWTLRGAGYTAAVKRVFNLARLTGCLQTGYFSWSYSITSREDRNKFKPSSAPYWVPVCVPAVKSSDAILAFVRKLVNPLAS